MFAFAGASTFPTIQADMKDKAQFPKAVIIAMIGKVLTNSGETCVYLFSSVHDIPAHVCGGVVSTR